MLCGGALLGLYISAGLRFDENKGDPIIMVLGDALPRAMGPYGITKPPMESWQAAIALAGLGVAAVRTRIWERLADFMDASGRSKAEVVLILIGVIVSAVAMMKPEGRA